MALKLRFLTGVLVGLSLAVLLYVGVFLFQLGGPTNNSFWCYDITRRKLETASKIDRPKLLVVGGSGTLFGIKARCLQSRLGVPTVNLGTHAALGTDYVLELARRAAKPHDTVLLTFEYELYLWGNRDLDKWASTVFSDYIIARDPDYFHRLPISAQIDLGMQTPLQRLKRGAINKFITPKPVKYDGFSAYDPIRVDDLGDMTGIKKGLAHEGGAPKFLKSGLLTKGLPPDASGFIAITEFCRWAQSNQVRVLASFPNLSYNPEYDSPKVDQTIESIQRRFEALGVPVVGNAREVILPQADFYDTSYHLTEEASVARTERLATELAPFFK